MVSGKVAMEEKPLKIRIRRENKMSASKRLNLEEIEKELGFDKVQPVIPSGRDNKDMINMDDYFDDMYEDALREYYAKNKQ